MASVRISEDFSIIIRKAALPQHAITQPQLLTTMEADAPLDEDAHLLSFGPHFGAEAAHTFIQRLEALGLRYGDDFIDVSLILPDWCQLTMTLRGDIPTQA